MKKVLLSIIATLLSTTAGAYDVMVDGIFYNLNTTLKTAEVTSDLLDGYYQGDITIPSEIVYNEVKYIVTSIGKKAFYECRITAVDIPNTVLSIGESAFGTCQSLTSINIPNGVTSIGSYAFSSCSNLSFISIPPSLSSIGSNAFNRCTKLKSVNISDIAAWCNLNYSGSIIYGKGKLLINGEEIEHLEIPQGLTSIPSGSFSYFTNITSVSIPNSVVSIEGAFVGCENITQVSIPNSVTKIGGAFRDCSSLVSVNIPNSVETLGNAFENCSSLKAITIPDGITKINSYTFRNCTSLMTVSIPNSITSIEEEAFSGCSSLASVVIPNSVKTIGRRAFSGCSSLMTINISNSITSIEDYTFYNCTGLTSVKIPNGVSTIGEYAFYGCNGLTSVTIPNGVTLISKEAFRGCPYIKSIYCYCKKIPIIDRMMDDSIYEIATLYVPESVINDYRKDYNWKKFSSIVGVSDEEIDEPQSKCSKPLISYSNGKLIFTCETDEVTFHSNITDSDIASFNSSEVLLKATYNISVFASKAGYEDSDVSIATLCWIDAEPRTDGITNGIAAVRANPILIQINGNMLNIQGAEEGSEISVYNLAGQKVGSAPSKSNGTSLMTSLQSGDVGIVKIKQTAIKIVIK